MEELPFELVPFRESHAKDARIQALLADIPAGPLLDLNRMGGLANVILVNDMPVGVVTILPSGECIVAVHVDFQRHGLASRALEQSVDFVFTRRKISRVWANTIPGHAGTALAIKFGAPRESETAEQVAFAVTKDEWQKRRSGA